MNTEPGVYQGLTFQQYHAIEAVNHSTLEPFTRSAAHARERILNGEPESDDLTFGQAFHLAMLEPERFALEYVVPPKIDKRFKVGKAEWAEWKAANPNRQLLTSDEFDAIERMRVAVAMHPTAAELLDGTGANELTLVWADPETGTLCKARLDRFTSLVGWPFIVDLKTARDARERAFSADIAKLGYHRQAGWYRRGLNILRPGETRFAFLAVEKERPHAVAVWELDERGLEQGEREAVAHLRAYEHAQSTGLWPAYDAGLGLIDVPAWAADKLDLGG